MTVGYLFSAVITHLPVLAVLIAGLIVVHSRRARLGARSTTLARLGLGALLLGQLLDIAWFMVLPQIISSMDYSSRNYGIMSLIVGMSLALLVAAGLGLLIAALVTRAPAGPFEPGQPGAGGPFGAAPPGAGGSFEPGQPGAGGPFGTAPPGAGGSFAPGPYQSAPGGYGGGFQPPAQAPGPDATWSSPGASGFGPGSPPTGPPAGR